MPPKTECISVLLILGTAQIIIRPDINCNVHMKVPIISLVSIIA